MQTPTPWTFPSFTCPWAVVSAGQLRASERAGKEAGHTQSKLTVYLRHPMGSDFDWSAANEQVREGGAINQSLLALHVGDGLAMFAEAREAKTRYQV